MDSGNEYVIQVKANQKILYQGIERTIEQDVPLGTYVKEEMNRGRLEKRKVEIYKYNDMHIPIGWKNLNRVIQVTNEGMRDKQPYQEIHLYISSLHENDAGVFAKGIRRHWSIENQLHWVKDVIQNEDKSLILQKQIASNLSLIKSMVISIFRIKGFHSIKKAIERFKNRIPETCELIDLNYIR